MKYIISLLVGLIATATMAQDVTPEIVTSSFQKFYVPQGFDSNDRVQIVGEGFFSNSCYRPGQVTAAVDHKNKLIKIKSTALRYKGVCLQVIVNYSSVVNVGVLKAGDYSIVQGEQDRKVGSLHIKGARVSNPDDFIYAPINQALLTKVDGKVVLTLTGVYTNNCMDLDRIKVKNQGDVIVVQPIVHYDSDDLCEDGDFPFSYTKEVLEPIGKGRYLLHIRSMNGKAMNNLVDIR